MGEYSNHVLYLTSTPVEGAKILSRAHSFKDSLMNKTNNDTFLCLIEESHINYMSTPSILMVMLPFIVSFISEGSLVGTPNYIEYPHTFIEPIRDYLLIDSLPIYTMYENFYNSLNKDLTDLGYSPETIKLIHYEVGKILSNLSFHNKNKLYNTEISVELFNDAWELNKQIKHLK